jgi:GcrA cell cycle regulator
MTSGHDGNHNAAKWEPEHDEALRRNRSEGLSGAQSAAALNDKFHTGYSRNSVIGRLHRLGLTEPMAKRIPRGVVTRKNPERKPRLVPPTLPPSKQIESRTADVIPLHLPLADLKPHDCRYPFGDAAPFSFCGHGRMAGSSYCFEHLCLTRKYA